MTANVLYKMKRFSFEISAGIILLKHILRTEKENKKESNLFAQYVGYSLEEMELCL
jgi:hypothetical protein